MPKIGFLWQCFLGERKSTAAACSLPWKRQPCSKVVFHLVMIFMCYKRYQISSFAPKSIRYHHLPQNVSDITLCATSATSALQLSDIIIYHKNRNQISLCTLFLFREQMDRKHLESVQLRWVNFQFWNLQNCEHKCEWIQKPIYPPVATTKGRVRKIKMEI